MACRRVSLRSLQRASKLSQRPRKSVEAAKAAIGLTLTGQEVSFRSLTPPTMVLTHTRGFAATAAKGPSGMYQAKVDKGEIHKDNHQLAVLKLLDRIHAELQHYAPAAPEAPSSGGLFGNLFGSNDEPPPPPTSTAPKGLYLHGTVGTGKTFLMDMLYDSVETSRKTRVHFNAFMLDVHSRVHALETDKSNSGDPLPKVAASLAREAWLLCFDEMQVTNIADALILKRLFDELWLRGVVVIATSNRPPDDLYKGGLQRTLFVPFIEQLKSQSVVHNLSSGIDYRRAGHFLSDLWFTPVGPESDAALQKAFLSLTGGKEGEPSTIPVMMGRHVHIRCASMPHRVCRVSFNEMCAKMLGAADYIAVAETFHTVILSGIPLLTPELRNETKRFITFLDELYQKNVRVVFSADAKPENLLQVSADQSATKEEVFMFDRAVSRMLEMQSEEYLEKSEKREFEEERAS